MKPAVAMKLVDGTTAIVRSEVMHKLMSMVERVARQDAAVLIVGETGSGKEMIAQAIHQHSLRCGKAFVDVNCAVFPEHLVESELFGYEKGAFSGADATKPGLFELADQGTLFLDEVGELDSKVQAKLLRVLDGVPYYRLGGSRKVDVHVRVIAATNRDLEEEVRNGRFRRDLYHRLTQFQLRVPPLRERTEDIPAIAEHFLLMQLPAARFTDDALTILQRYSWPGNVRELKNVVSHSTVSLNPGTTEIRASDLPAAICGLPEVTTSTASWSGNLEEMERYMILQALAQNGDNQAKAAQQLGISARTLRRKLDKYRKEKVAGSRLSVLGSLRVEQQRYFRVTVEIPVTLHLESQQIAATIVNLSSGGLAIETPVPIAHGASMELSFLLPETKTIIEAKAKLAWTSPGGLVGLSFEDMHPALDSELQQWLLERTRAEGWTETDPAR
ncbi:MAG TPA: sigma 54-interacting transcriptional regulator [Terriglobales bacterium]|nr:sigma 54-interacting transcriptional regulator [Terriglobales bacterium]